MHAKKMAVLDIGSDALTLVLQDNKYANNFTFKASADYDGYQDGEFLDIEGLFRAVDSLLQECEVATFSPVSEVMVGVPGEFTAVVCKNISYDLGVNRRVSARDLDALYALGNDFSDLENYTPISASPVYFMLDNGTGTITPIGAETSKLDCLMSYVVCEKQFISLFDKIAENAGVKFTYASSVLAEVMYVVPERRRDEGVVLADIGYISSSVAFAKGDGLLHSASFSLGGGNIAGDITMVDNIPFEHSLALLDKINLNLEPTAEGVYRISSGGESVEYNIAHINEIASARVQNIAETISLAISASEYIIPPSATILLTGSGLASIPGAKECISKITGRNVEILTPELMQFNKPRYASLAGLLLVQQHGVTLKHSGISEVIRKIKDKFRRNKNNG